jgi:hypothetical protein
MRLQEYFNCGEGGGGEAENYEVILKPFKNVYIDGPRATGLNTEI